jgi:hypothetical protein
MKIGHICLADEGSEDCERLAVLVEAMSRQNVEQHVLVASVDLARRLAGHSGVSVGPIVRSPVLAYCLMPNVDIVHIHDGDSGQAGLLLTLTRSIPFVLTADERIHSDPSPLARAVLNRAACTIQNRVAEPADLLASDTLRVYEEALSGCLELPENSNCRH